MCGITSISVPTAGVTGRWSGRNSSSGSPHRVSPMNSRSSAAQTSAGFVIWFATHLGYPLSTTHVVSGAVMGAGATKRLSAVRWGVAGNIAVAWLLTIPMAAGVAALLFYPIKLIF